MAQAITINVSDTLYERLKKTASLFHRSAEAIILESLRHSLPTLFEEIPAECRDEMFPLLGMSDRELLEESRRTFPQDQWRIYESLLERKKNEGLNPDEEAALGKLRQQADALTFRRSYAAVLLQRRKYNAASDQQGTGHA